MRSARVLVTRPGWLTLEFTRGRRRAYASPLQLFLLVNVVFFFSMSLTGFRLLSVPFQGHVFQHPWGDIARELGRRKAVASGYSQRQLQERFDETTHTQSKSLVVLLVPLFSIAVAVAHARPRRYYLEHLVFAMHGIAVFLVLECVVLGTTVPARAFALNAGIEVSHASFDGLVTLIQLMAFGVYLAFASSTVYGGTPPVVLARALVMTVAVIPVIFTYRFMLLFSTMWAI